MTDIKNTSVIDFSDISDEQMNEMIDGTLTDFDEGDLREKNQFLFPGKTEKIRFSFSGLSVQAILDRLPTAKVVEQNGNTSMIEAEVNHGRGIVMYLLSQGAWVKVLSPQSLVEEMQEELRQMCSAYDI